MDCRHVQDHIVPYIEAELSPTMHTWINEHLKDCDTCATLGQHLQNLEMPQLPEPSIEQMLSMHHALEQTLQEKSRYLGKPHDIETGFRLFYETLHRSPSWSYRY